MRFVPVAAVLCALVGSAAANPEPAPAARASAGVNSDRIVLHVVGDVAWPDGWGGIGHIDEQQGELFSLVRPILAKGDLNFANLECPLTTARAVIAKTYPITCNPKRLKYALEGGPFNVFSLANNHALDAGGRGIDDTLALFRDTDSPERPIWWAGVGANQSEAGEPVIIEVPGKTTRIAMFALSNAGAATRVGSLHAPDLHERIAAAAKSHDIVMVSVHYGPEYVHTPTKPTVDRFHALIDAGASLVVAHHAHVVQGVERYGKGFIFYNLGNFSFGSRTRRHFETGARLYSMIGRVVIEGDALASVELVPLYANNSANWTLEKETLPPRHATPQPLFGAFADYAIGELQQFTASVPTDSPTALHRVGDRLFVDMAKGPPPVLSQVQSLHEQRHERADAIEAGGGPREATEGEVKRVTRAGTPLNAKAMHAAAEKKKAAAKRRAANKRRRSKRRGKHRRSR